jgi:ribosomal protein S6
MRKYECLFIFSPEEAPEAWKEEEKRLEETIRRFGGRTLDRRDWGRRSLGYSLQKTREGRILLWNFEMETHQIGEFRKALELDEKILKMTLVKTVEPKPVRETKKKREGVLGRQP